MLSDVVSIVVPVYNGAGFLSTCVHSALKQTYCHIEVIIVNDGSSDGTSGCAEELQKTDSRIRVFNIPNSGVTAARRVGVDNAKGDWVCFLDVDDILPETAIEQYSVLFPDNSEIIASGEAEALTLSEYKVGLMMRKCHPELWGKLFRTEFIKKHYPVVDRSIIIGEDQIINIVLANKATKLATVKDWLYLYNLDNCESVTKRFRHTAEYENKFETVFNQLVLPDFDPSDPRLKYGEFKMKIEGFKMVVLDGNRFDPACEEWKVVVSYYRKHRDQLAISERLLICLSCCQWLYAFVMKMTCLSR